MNLLKAKFPNGHLNDDCRPAGAPTGPWTVCTCAVLPTCEAPSPRCLCCRRPKTLPKSTPVLPMVTTSQLVDRAGWPCMEAHAHSKLPHFWRKQSQRGHASATSTPISLTARENVNPLCSGAVKAPATQRAPLPTPVEPSHRPSRRPADGATFAEASRGLLKPHTRGHTQSWLFGSLHPKKPTTCFLTKLSHFQQIVSSHSQLLRPKT